MLTKKNIRPLPILLGAVVLAGLVYGFFKIRFMMTHENTENSYLEADIVPLSPKVQGFIAEVRVAENQYVHAGDTLFILDNRDFLLRLKQAQAALANAESNVAVVAANASATTAGVGTADANVQTSTAAIKVSSAGLQTANANVSAAQARVWKATQDFNRYKALQAQRAATQQQLDQAKTEKESAEAALDAARGQLETATRQVDVSKSQTAAGKQQVLAVESQANAARKNIGLARSNSELRQLDVENAQLNLSYTVITAPVSGFVVKKAVQIGQLVNIGAPLCSLISDKNLWVTANFKETQVAHMHAGQAVEVNIDAYPGKHFQGKIESIAPATGAKFSLLPPDNASGNFVKVVQRIPVRITLTETPDPQYPLRAGMSVEVIAPI